MKNYYKTLTLLFLLMANYTTGLSQRVVKSMISIENNHLIARIDNPIRIIAQQMNPVSLNQLSATIQVYDGERRPIEITGKKGYFTINPDTIGIVEIKIEVGDTTEVKQIRVEPLKAIGRLGGHRANTDAKIGVGLFKAQGGIIASVECCGFDAKCKVLGFEIIRITPNNSVERVGNTGGRYNEEARDLIVKAASKDVFVFRRIMYRCAGTGSPQRLEDMIFEIE